MHIILYGSRALGAAFRPIKCDLWLLTVKSGGSCAKNQKKQRNISMGDPVQFLKLIC